MEKLTPLERKRLERRICELSRRTGTAIYYHWNVRDETLFIQTLNWRARTAATFIGLDLAVDQCEQYIELQTNRPPFLKAGSVVKGLSRR